MAANQQRDNSCTNCHQFTSGLTGVKFCSAECTHEWSSKLIDAETPAQVWEIVKLVKQLSVADGTGRATVTGKLIQLARAIWPNESEAKNG